MAGLVQVEQLAVRPHVGAVARDEDRDVTQDADAASRGVAVQCLPLAEDDELHPFLRVDRPREADVPAGDGLGPAPGDVGLPVGPWRAAVRVLERHEERIVVEPGAVRGAERLEGGGEWFMPRQALDGAAEQRQLPRNDGVEVDVVVGEGRRVGEVGGRQQPVGDERVGAGEERARRERGVALVGRVVRSRGAEGQHLPDAELGGGEEVDEVRRLGAEVTDSPAAGQRRRMEEQAAGAWQSQDLRA